MSYIVYLSLLPPVLLGILFVLWLLLPTGKANFFLVLSLGLPTGFGISSCLLFLWSYIFNPGNNWFELIEFGLIAFLLYLLWKQKLVDIQYFISFLKDKNKVHWLLGIAALVVTLFGIAIFINYTTLNPHGRYDAWAIWNVRARMLARAGDHWKSVFIPQVFHADYPLLLPLTIAHSWILAGTESMRIPPAIAGLFTFSCAGILSGSLFSLKRWNPGWLASIILLSTPWVLFFGSKQFADLPLAAYILAASACLCLAFIYNENSTPWLILAGLSAGFAGWTKNEGQLFLVVFCFITGITILLLFKNKSLKEKKLAVGIGLLLPILAILIFKFDLAPANDVVNTSELSPAITSMLKFSRYGEALDAMLRITKAFGGWAFPVPVFVFVAYLLIRPEIGKGRAIIPITLGFLILFQLIGYYMIYIITPHQLTLHINQSFDRLLMHLYPTFLLLIFSTIRPMEEISLPIKKPI
jgi:hypothetical protein